MPKPLVIIITGLPGTGKTTLGRRLASELKIPMVSKDDFKELLFDTLGWKDREWSKKVGRASRKLLYHCLELLLLTGGPFIIESNFSPTFDYIDLLGVNRRHDFEPFLIHCKASGVVLFERFEVRAESGDRHPGHVDHLNYQEFRDVLAQGDSGPLDIGGRIFEVDTTVFDKVDYESISEAIAHVIRECS